MAVTRREMLTGCAALAVAPVPVLAAVPSLFAGHPIPEYTGIANVGGLTDGMTFDWVSGSLFCRKPSETDAQLDERARGVA